MSEVLEKLFRSRSEIRILRLFFNNPKKEFLAEDVSKKSKVKILSARTEIKNLEKIKFLISRRESKKVYYRINNDFIFYDELKKIIFKTDPISLKKTAAKLAKIGNVKFALIAGSLLNSDKKVIDIMIVGESINKNKLKKFLSNIEAEIGETINYSYMDTDEFRYRKNMFDKFISDIFENQHKILIDKLKIKSSREKSN